MSILKKKFECMQESFYENHMILNLGKCNYLPINKDIAKKFIELDKKTPHAEAAKKIIGLRTDKNLNFLNYTKAIIKTAKQKLSVHIRVVWNHF